MVLKEPIKEIKQGNDLFPVFLKLDNLRVLIIGGGHVALEKLLAVVQNSPPSTPIKLIALEIKEEIKEFAARHNNIELLEKPYQHSDLDESDIIIAGVNNNIISELIWKDAKEKGKLVNIADT